MLDAYRQAFAALPPALRNARAEHWCAFERSGFPDRRIEDWHYTDLSPLAERSYTQVAAPIPSLQGLSDVETLRFVNGAALDGEGEPSPAALADDGITQLNAALANAGLDRTAEGVEPRFLQLIVWTGGGQQAHLRHRLRLAPNSQLTLLLDLRGDDSASFSTGVLEVELGAGAQLDLIRVQEAGIAATDVARTQVRVARDATLRYVGLDLGGALARHDLNVVLAEPGARCAVHGVFAPGGKTHSDTHTRIVHAAPLGTSREVFRGLVMGSAQAVFNGRIEVHPGAQKTDSEQHVASLLLSPRAQVNAKPELEIHADDVKCAHGATCGRLDELAIYYLRTRGLDHAAAQRLLLFTFAHEVLGRIAWEPARKELERRLIARLPGGAELGELL